MKTVFATVLFAASPSALADASHSPGIWAVVQAKSGQRESPILHNTETEQTFALGVAADSKSLMWNFLGLPAGAQSAPLPAKRLRRQPFI